MIKILFIFLILLVVMCLVALRYRRQISMGLQLLRMFRKMRQVSKGSEKKIEKKTNSRDVQLIRCERCGAWTPPSDGLTLRSKTFYCSAKCMERAAKLQSMVD